VRRAARIVGTLLVAGGVLTLIWAVVVWQWQDPFTAIYTHIEQSRLESSYAKRARAYKPPPAPVTTKPAGQGAPSVAVRERQLAADARAYAKTLKTGDPVAKITVGRIGLHMVVVQGTDHDTLKKGPGHYLQSGLPGEGQLIYIAGHRTTYLAPFAHINDIRIGDYVTLEVPYGTFTYRVTRHWIVPSTDLAVLEDHGREVLRLQACHPRFFATHRYLVDARLVSITPRGGTAFAVPASTPTGT
jgi:sortase A